jgi:hypothetical protein
MTWMPAATELFGTLSDETPPAGERCAACEETDYALIMNFGGGGPGRRDPSRALGKEPRGIRRLEDWYVAHLPHPATSRRFRAANQVA